MQAAGEGAAAGPSRQINVTCRPKISVYAAGTVDRLEGATRCMALLSSDGGDAQSTPEAIQ
jgi:hypothetical protein